MFAYFKSAQIGELKVYLKKEHETKEELMFSVSSLQQLYYYIQFHKMVSLDSQASFGKSSMVQRDSNALSGQL